MFNRSIDDLTIIGGLGGSEDNNYECTEQEMKNRFDLGAKKVQIDLNDLMAQLEDSSAASNIGCSGNLGATLQAVINAIISAGTGTIPPNNTITTEKIVDGAVTSRKLASALLATINAVKCKMGKISDLTPSSTENGPGGSYVTQDVFKTYNLGFTPAAVLIFTVESVREDNNPGGTYSKNEFFDFICFGYERQYEYSNRYDETESDYGGIAVTNSPCIGARTGLEVHRIVENGVKIHLYNKYHEYSDGSDEYTIVSPGDYYIAIA